jgi:alpha-tubulin suppressor-like RCC1 family protein
MKKNYNFINNYKIELIVILILLLISIYFYYRENFISEGFTGEASGSVQFSRIACGFHHSLALTTDGKVYAWGHNYYGQLGLGNSGVGTNKYSPNRIPNLSNVSGIAAGEYYSLALTNDGKVYAWGYNGYGQLGLGNTTNQSSPVHVSSLSNVAGIAANTENNSSTGASHSLAFTNDGKVYSWGSNSTGQLGLGNNTDQSRPVHVSSLSNVSGITAGGNHSFALTNDGKVYAWGDNGGGQLGLGNRVERNIPAHVSSLSNVSGIAAGEYHSLAFTNNGNVYAWGYNGYGQLGLGNTTDQYSPVHVSSLSNVSGIAAGGHSHSLAFTTDGKVYAWGWNESGQLGLGYDSLYNYIKSPVYVSRLSNVTGIAAGEYHSLALTNDGKVYAWGANRYGQLGLGNTSGENTPALITNPINCVGDFVNDVDSECSAPCGDGTQKQIYKIITPAQFGGETCPNQAGEEKEIDCNTQSCPPVNYVGETYPPINCIGSFVNKSLCLPSNDLNLMCGPGTQTQKYVISQEAANGGIQCTYTQDQEQIVPCNLRPCPINCVGSFGAYGGCTKSCGGGKKERVYTITTEAQHDGIECPNKDGDKEITDCNTQACPINCEGTFVPFKSCSKECGTDGILLNKFNITQKAEYGGTQCDYEQNDILSEPCNRQPCPTYPENTAIQEALKDSNSKIQNIRYDIINRQEELDLLTNKFNRVNKNISFIKNNTKYIPDDETLTFY